MNLTVTIIDLSVIYNYYMVFLEYS